MTVDDTIGGSDRLLPDAALVKIEAATRRAATARRGFTDEDREDVRQDAVLEVLSGKTPPAELTDEEITRVANRCAKRVQRAQAKGRVISLDALAQTTGSHDPNIARRAAPLTGGQHAAVHGAVRVARGRVPVETRIEFAAWNVYKETKSPGDSERLLAEELAETLDVPSADVRHQVAVWREEDHVAILRGDLKRVQDARRQRMRTRRESPKVVELGRIIEIRIRSESK